MTRAVLLSVEWVAAGVFALCLYLAWAGDLLPAVADLPPGQSYFVPATIALVAGLWARSIARLRNEGTGWDRAFRLLTGREHTTGREPGR